MKSATELKSVYFWRCVFGEFISTMLFCWLANSISLSANQRKNEQDAAPYYREDSFYILAVAIEIGFCAASVSLIFTTQYGGYMNPAVMIGHFVCWRNSILKTVLQCFFQFFAGVLGACISNSIHEDSHDMAFPHLQVSVWHGFAMEGMLTFVLVLVMLKATKKHKDHLSSIAYAFIIVATHAVGVKFTGFGLNPARVFGVAMVRTSWPDYCWIYWAGPFTGSVAAGVLYGLMSIPKPDTDKEELESEELYVIHKEVVPKYRTYKTVNTFKRGLKETFTCINFEEPKRINSSLSQQIDLVYSNTHL